MKKTTIRRRRKRGRPVADSPVHIDAWRARCEDVIDRHARLRAEWIADEEWQPQWAMTVGKARRMTSSWPPAMAARVGGVTAFHEARSLPWTLQSSWRDAVQGISDWLWATIGVIVAVPAGRLPVVPALPRSSTEARAQWLEARATYTNARVAVRGIGQRRRAELQEHLEAAVWEFRTC